MANGKMVNQMEKVLCIMLMESMMANGKIVYQMEKVFIILLMVANKNLFSKMENK